MKPWTVEITHIYNWSFKPEHQCRVVSEAHYRFWIVAAVVCLVLVAKQFATECHEPMICGRIRRTRA